MKAACAGVLVATFVFCNPPLPDKEILSSPSGLYNLHVEFNTDKNEPSKYACLKLLLFDKQGKQLSSLQTNASEFSKWAIDWHPHGDTIILFSQDVGTYSYKVANDQTLQQITVTPEIDSLGIKTFNKKYHTSNKR
ncbi:MAG TPA: hypothetical protein VE978_00345 [Chitinophagales bacterium]|nr:hypothetical protein [Chitinophagales bacterium]